MKTEPKCICDPTQESPLAEFTLGASSVQNSSDRSPCWQKKRRLYHALKGILGLSSLVQQLAVLQLLAHMLQGVEGFVELHGHRHFGQVLADVVSQDVPEVDVAGVGTGCRQAGAPPVTEGAASKVSVGHYETDKRQCLS